MSKRGDPWFKFYPRDWLRDTRWLTLEQRGAYIDTIAMQMERGAPLPDDCAWLAHQMHISTRKAKAIVEGLIAAVMLKRTDGGISNKRCEEELLAREHQRQVNISTASAREHSKREPALETPRASVDPELSELFADSKIGRKANSISVKPEISCNEGGTTRTGAHARPDTDTEIDKKDTPLSPPKGGGDLDQKFEEWWVAYPAPPARKVGKGEALALFRQLITGNRQSGDRKNRRKVHTLPRTTADELLAAVKAYAASKPDYVPGPVVWLNQGRWLDDVCKGAGAVEQPWWKVPEKITALTAERWRDGIRKYANGTWPVDKLGPPPGHAECVVPADIVRDLRLTEVYTDKGIKRT